MRFLACVSVGLAVSSAAALEPARAPGGPILARERLSGDWWGVRTDLESRGVTVGGGWLGEFSSVLGGGVRERGSFRNLLTIDAELDLENLIGLEGGTVFAQYLSVNPETGGSADAGDIQGYSNLESARHLDVIYELWYEQRLFGDRLRVKVGKVDANSEFAFIEAAGDFANSSAGFSPTIFAFPTYPDPAMSVNVFGRVVDGGGAGLTLGYGLYDGAGAVDGVRTGGRGPSALFSGDRSDDYFHVAEAALDWDGVAGGEWRQGRLAVGAWLHTGEFERFDGGVEDGHAGLYLSFEQRIAPGHGGARGGSAADGLHVFAQYGWADEAVSAIGQHVAGGVILRGTFEGRDEDSAGLYVTLADLSDEPGAGFAEDELAFDAYYRLRLAPAVFVQPEVQYIANPSGDRSIDEAVVGGLRVGVTF